MCSPILWNINSTPANFFRIGLYWQWISPRLLLSIQYLRIFLFFGINSPWTWVSRKEQEMDLQFSLLKNTSFRDVSSWEICMSAGLSINMKQQWKTGKSAGGISMSETWWHSVTITYLNKWAHCLYKPPPIGASWRNNKSTENTPTVLAFLSRIVWKWAFLPPAYIDNLPVNEIMDFFPKVLSSRIFCSSLANLSQVFSTLKIDIFVFIKKRMQLAHLFRILSLFLKTPQTFQFFYVPKIWFPKRTTQIRFSNCFILVHL